MNTLYTVYLVIGITVLFTSLASGLVKRKLWVSEPLLAMGVGIALGPYGVGLLDPARWAEPERLLEELARVTLAISLMGVAFRLPDTWVRRQWRSLAVLLVAGMPAMWLVTSFLGWAALDLPVLEALVLGALVTPTDPVVADSIVTGKLAEESVDEDTRHMISGESGANDGLAYLLVMLPVLLLERSTESALAHWATVVLLGEVLGSIAGGALAGWFVARLMEKIYEQEQTHRGSILAVTLALALALLGMARLLHGDGILAVFAAGLAFNWVVRSEEGHEEAQHERMQETTTRFFDVPVFVFFGLVAPMGEWAVSSLWLFAGLVLILRRLPVIWLLGRVVPPLKGTRNALFAGWFGPIGVAAMVYAAWADVHEGYHQLWVAASLTIFVSIVLHGISATPFTRLYGGWGESSTSD